MACGEVGVAVHKPAPLKRGGRIGVLAPAGCVSDELLLAGVQALQQEGFQVELAPGVHERKGYLAGDDEKRACDLEAFFCWPDLDAIFCARGGFGSIQLLPHLTERIRSHPKIFAGYSDVTILLNWLLQNCGMVTFHAPMVAMDFARGLTQRSRDHLWGTLTGEKWSGKLGSVMLLDPARCRLKCWGDVFPWLLQPWERLTKSIQPERCSFWRMWVKNLTASNGC